MTDIATATHRRPTGSRQRWVLVTSSFPISSDGSEAAGAFVADLVRELSRHVEVRVVAPGREAGCETWEHVEIHRFAAPDHPLSLFRPWRPRDIYWIGKVLRGGAAATRRASVGADHILALWGLPCGEWARRIAAERGIDYSVWMLGSDVWSLGRVPVLKGYLAKVMREARHAYADGYQLAEDASRIGKVPVAFLPSSRQLDGTSTPVRQHAPYRLIYLGRWHANKGVDLLLDSLAQLEAADWGRIESVDIYGGGPMDAVVRARVAELQARGWPVRMGGFLAKEQAVTAILQADWLLIPSRIESIPVIFSDAMKLGRPVVSTPVGDLGRLMSEGGVGICAASADSGAFAAALRQLPAIMDRALPESLQAMARRFSIEATATRLLGSTDR